MFDKLQGLKKIKQMGLPYPQYISIDSKEARPHTIEELINKLGIPNLEGERIGIVVRTSGTGRLGGRSNLHLTNVKEIVDWAIKLKNKNEAHAKLIIQHVVDAKCSGVILKDSETIVEVVKGDAPSLLEGKTMEIEQWVFANNVWKQKNNNLKQIFLNKEDLESLEQYISIMPKSSYFEWSLSKNGNFYFYEFMARKKKKIKEESFIVTSRQIKGNGSSPGIVVGFVNVITDLTNISNVGKGEVLVIPYADRHVEHIIGKIAAVITETGGVTSHAAIIAREFEVPCIVGVENATKKLKDGMKVTVNGSSGIIYIMDR